MIRCLFALAVIATPVAAKGQPNTLTHDMVQMTLRVGETTQAQVLETFGAPNLLACGRDTNRRSVWSKLSLRA